MIGGAMRQIINILTVGIVVLIVGVILIGVVIPRESVVVPHITLASAQSSPIVATHTYPFEQAAVTITLPVDAALYNGAKSTDKSVAIRGNVSKKVWVSNSYQVMINDSAQDGFYRDLTGEFSRMKQEQHLTDDEYVELMMAYVQSLTYVTKPNNPAKFPVETAVDNTGDCDDKSLLLAGLLATEGYKVALLVFDPESHMAVGIGSPDLLYKGTGYAYIETTNFSFAGVPPDTLKGGVALRSEPLVIPIGSGTKVYTGGRETAYINDAVTRADQKAAELAPQVESLDTELTAKQRQIAALEAQMQQLKSAGNIPAYNAQVSTHNTLVSEYNAQLSTYRSLVSQYSKYSDLHNYVLDHAYDRKGTYEYVKKQMPASQYGAVMV
jgi:hypothetical protein